MPGVWGDGGGTITIANGGQGTGISKQVDGAKLRLPWERFERECNLDLLA